VTGRLTYVIWGASGLMFFGLLVLLASLSLTSPPAVSPGHWHYELLPIAEKDVLWGRAVEGSYPTAYLDNISMSWVDELRVPFPYLNFFSMRREVASEALQVVVKQKLPDGTYVAVLYDKQPITNEKINSVIVPLEKKAEAVYASPPFLTLCSDKMITSYQGYRVLVCYPPDRVEGQVERVVVDKP